MKLKAQVAQDHKDNLAKMNAYYTMRSHQMGKLINVAKDDAIKIIAAHLSILPKIDGPTAKRLGVLKTIERDVQNRMDTLGHELNDLKETMLRQVNLWGRLFVGFVARKAQPPWMPVKLDLYNGFKVKSDWEVRTHFYLKNMATTMVREVTQGVMNEESMHDILQRIRPMFRRGLRSKEADWKDPFLTAIKRFEEGRDLDTWEQTEQIFDKPAVSISEGVYTLEDVNQLQADQADAMKWSHRQYRPWFDETLKRSNRDLRAFEVNMMSDLTGALHEGMIQIGSENMGVEDFTWRISRPQPKCDECTKRDGLTTKEISKTIKDEFGDQPPPLHPNCMCQLVPTVRSDWSQDELNKSGFEFDPENGVSFEPTDKQRELGFTDMSWDDWLDNIGH